MAFVPNTNLSLLTGIPFNNNYEHTRWFDNQPQQFEYFFNRRFATFNDFTYQKPTNSVRVPINYESVYKCTYVMYQNTNFGNKWFYAFVTHIEYVNPQVTELTLELDLMQTWQFEMSMKQCFIEREHVADDTVGAHTVPEGLEYGDYITTAHTELFFNRWDYYITVAEPVSAAGVTWNAPTIISGQPANYFYARETDITVVGNIINTYAIEGKLDAVIAIFLLPQEYRNSMQWNNFNLAARTMSGAVKNNKCLCYPYAVCELLGSGTTSELHYELLTSLGTTSSCTFAPNATAYFMPSVYASSNYTSEYGVSVTGFPAMGFIGNYYQNWMAQNGGQLLANAVSMVTNTAASAVNPISFGAQTVSNINQIANNLATVYKASVTPDSYKGSIGAGSALVSANEFGVRSKCKTIRPEYLEIIDNYFTRYGYKVNRIGTPEIYSRRCWNYIKTIGSIVSGNFDAETASQICDIFDSGITLWHVDDIGNYYQDNNIV